ncbi:alpha/beta fold hydrolase [Labedaea rhizosphaerae]|uniref:Alpha/beta hydrolase family protein n=1 Tax=Labedaea rhizosphaerae TaxID=598644 RepID=A0A4R6SB92_LABRH|nr:alpha/beta hydrolase [Labedaea rhizosphaerae]TDP97181.1 alpha/beta hydrolase family protein [Labedaea rhizosphaerae]
MDFVLLHGTSQGPRGWQLLIDTLAGRGHRAIAVDFPTGRPELLAHDYARIAADQVDVETPVVVAHSGAGLLLPAVADALDARHLVWLAAPVPDFAGGSSFVDQITQDGPELVGDEWRSSGTESTTDPVVAAYFGFHDCDLATLRWAVTTMRLFYPQAVYAEAAPPPPRRPSTAVVPRHDRTLRPEWMARVARERLGVEPVEVDGGHFPHVSRPEELADILVRVSSG